MCWGVFLKHVFLNSSWMFGAYILKGWLEKPPCLCWETTSPSLPNLHRKNCVFTVFFVLFFSGGGPPPWVNVVVFL